MCTVPAGNSSDLDVELESYGRVARVSGVFSYAAPRVTGLSPTTLTAATAATTSSSRRRRSLSQTPGGDSGGNSSSSTMMRFWFNVSGENFGTNNESRRVYVGTYRCAEEKGLTTTPDSMIECVVSDGAALVADLRLHTVTVVVGAAADMSTVNMSNASSSVAAEAAATTAAGGISLCLSPPSSTNSAGDGGSGGSGNQTGANATSSGTAAVDANMCMCPRGETYATGTGCAKVGVLKT